MTKILTRRGYFRGGVQKTRMGDTSIRRYEEMRPKVDVVYKGNDGSRLHDAYRLLAEFFTEAQRENRQTEEVGEE